MSATEAAALRRSDEILTSDINGEMVLLNPETGDCYSLSGVGAMLWQLVADPSTIDQIVEGVCARFDVDPDVARSDAEKFLEELIDEGLVLREPVA